MPYLESFTLVQLKYFMAVAEHKSMTVASGALHLSQSTLSASILKLEKQLDVTLFIRDARKGLKLTNEGELLLHESYKLFAQVRTLHDKILEQSGSEYGELNIGCFSSFAPRYMPLLVKSFSREFPHLRINIIEGTLEELFGYLSERKCDLVICYDPGDNAEYEKILIKSNTPKILVSENHQHALKEKADLADFIDDPMIMLDIPHSRDYFQRILSAVGSQPRIGFTTNNYETLRSLVAHNLGYAITTQDATSDQLSYDDRKLRYLDIRQSLPPINMVFLKLRVLPLPKRVYIFIQHALTLLQERDLSS